MAWRATLRDGTNYVREDFEIAADRGADLASIMLIDLHLQQPWVAGTADGSPLVAGDNFYGIEHPMAHAQILQGRATATLKRVLPLRAGVSERYSAVLGVRRMNVRCGHGRRSRSRYDPAKCWSGI